MKQDDVNNKIIDALNQKAMQHPQRQRVINGVFARIEEKRHAKYNRWGLTGLALAAAITGISVVPNMFHPNDEAQQKVAMSSPKLTPQLADDLEMLLVLGEDTQHGS